MEYRNEMSHGNISARVKGKQQNKQVNYNKNPDIIPQLKI